MNEYIFPLDEREILDGIISDEKNVFIKSGNCLLINVEKSVFDTVTITKGENKMGYTFLAARPEVYVSMPKFPYGYCPSYAAGYTKVIYTDAKDVTVKIPDNAKYLYIHNNSYDLSCVPSKIKFTKTKNSNSHRNSVRIATWNIGHFSLGMNPNTSISDSDFENKAAEYEDYIYNVLDADVISLNEYSKMFTPSKSARETVFSKYATAFEGNQYHYSCNAFYSRTNFTNIRENVFECNKTADMESPYGIYASDYYYVTGDLNINGTSVKLVSAHLAFYAGKSSTRPPIIENQINELIDTFKDCDKVIIMGDWNCQINKLAAFKNAGYSLANNDSTIPTYSESGSSLDNFVYKGVTVSDFGLGGTRLSDHYAIYCTVTVD